jgi:alanine racemase
MAANQITPHWIEIKKTALEENVALIRKQLRPDTKFMAMVKANAYGHGLAEVSPILSPLVDYFGVHTLADAVTLRKLGLKNKILITSPVPVSQIALVQKHRLSVCVPSLEYLQSIKDIHIPVHLKIDTGMNRLGLSLIDLLSALEILRHSSLTPEGIYTHFHSADENETATLIQLDAFEQAVFQTKYCFPAVLAHCSNSAAIFRYPKSHLDMVRSGLAVYGLYPHPDLKPILAWKAHPAQSRLASKGETVGYGASFTFDSPRYMSVLPFGYSDGYDRKLSNSGIIYFKKSLFPVVGRISMNFTTIATGNINLKNSDVVEIIGPHVPVQKIAGQVGTIDYEIVSRLDRSIPRIIV